MDNELINKIGGRFTKKDLELIVFVVFNFTCLLETMLKQKTGQMPIIIGTFYFTIIQFQDLIYIAKETKL